MFSFKEDGNLDDTDGITQVKPKSTHLLNDRTRKFELNTGLDSAIDKTEDYIVNNNLLFAFVSNSVTTTINTVTAMNKPVLEQEQVLKIIQRVSLLHGQRK